jgi:cell wall-associated NlpC family hydrolase
MILRFKLALMLCVVVCASAFAGQDTKMVSLGRVAQAKTPVKIFSRPSTRSHVYYSVRPNEYLVVRDYKKDSPYKLVLMSNMRFGYALAESMDVLNYEYKVPETSAPVALSMPRPTGLSSRNGSDLRAAVAQYSMNFKGTPYVWGGNDLKGGVDCSGFVKQLYGQIGLDLPRTAAQQVNVGIPVKRLEDLQPGDRLYFWDANRGIVGHTGIYYGNGYFVHSSRTHRGVDKDYLGDPKWMRILVAARR